MILKSSKIYKELKKVKSNFDCLIVPVNILNIIEHHKYFEQMRFDDDYYVGKFCNLNVYLDLLLHPNQIVLSYDKETIRDNKINSILTQSDNITEFIIEIYD